MLTVEIRTTLTLTRLLNTPRKVGHGFRFRRDRLVWRCVKDNCKGRARYNGVMYEMYQDHICQAPDPNEIEKAVFNHEIRQQAEQCHDPRKPSRRT
ncbi:unnamed protein product [Didymodactylos carnosus]|uniref:FLYWCH-type domain-containing protein n=1 Tax=Didymodactylos carnosus TaxID=1234261 RepID=A0A8S2FPC8_9BILA|nr:unnamed protein product [Didymodactylos carnosus]CAF4300771.1 unnamed protein product [Didymodactylos carnosus]